MKIYDIICEDSDLEERASLIQWALGGGKAASVDKLATQWADDIVKAWRNGTKPTLSWPQGLPRNMSRDPAVIKDALKKAKSQARKLVIKGTTTRVMATAANAAKIFTNVVWGAAVSWGVGEPIIKTYNNIATAEEAMESGNPDWTQEAVDAYARRELAWCVAQVSAVLATAGTAALATRLTFIKRFFPNLANVASASAIAWMAEGDGREAIANWIVGSSLSSTIYEKYVGGLMLRARDEVKKFVGSETPAAGPTAQSQASTGTTSQDRARDNDAGSQSEPAATATAADSDTPLHKRPDARTGRIL